MNTLIAIPTIPTINRSLGKVLTFGYRYEAMETICNQLAISFRFADDWEAFLQRIADPQQRPDLILFDLSPETASAFQQIRYFMLKEEALMDIPFVVLSEYPSIKWQRLCQKFRVTDYILTPLADQHTYSRLERLVLRPRQASVLPKVRWKMPLWKRAVDVLGAATLLLLLSPVLVLIAVLIKLESRGPIFYVSKRAGQGFRVFDFIKFRSMRQDADQLVDQLKDLNQYNCPEEPKLDTSVLRSKPADETYTVLIGDDEYVFEEEQTEEEQTFFKIKNDPRITRVGNFIRNTSLDELPQLFNVLRGDMSLVGNRPLPLYEAEQLTCDESVLRFAAPAGITGLWQVSKRGKGDMSEAERKQLDLEYALNYSFWMDLTILWKTLPAAIQEESV
ncbi:MAG: sugar transferase [Bacteroidota bacterium]